MLRYLSPLSGLAFCLFAASTAHADMTVTGEFKYVDREFSFSGGWTGNKPTLPVRLADFDVIDAATDQVLASGVTGQNGRFSVDVKGLGTKDILVRCYAQTTSLGPSVIEVLGIGSGLLYSVASATFSTWDLSANLDVGSVTADTVFSGSLQGNPFNVLDNGTRVFEYVESMGAAPSVAPVTVYWPGGTQSQAMPTVVYISTDDGYDDAVIAHEFGHVIDFRYSEPDSNGGSHSFGQSNQNPSLSLGEGFATYIGCAAREHAGLKNSDFYMDANGGPTNGPASIQLRARLENRFPYTGITGGEADEVAVAAALWDVYDGQKTKDGSQGTDDDLVDGSYLFPGGLSGGELVWASMTGSGVLKAKTVHIVDVWNGLFIDGGADHYAELSAAFDSSKIRVAPDSFEPDNLPSQATPIVAGAGWSPIHTLYSNAATPPVPGSFDGDWFSFSLPLNHKYEFETRYPNGLTDAETYADTAIILDSPSTPFIDLSGYGGMGRNAKIEGVITEAGTYRAAVLAEFTGAPTGSYQVRLVDLGPVQPPTVVTVSPTELVTVEPPYKSGFKLTGGNFLGTSSVTVGGVSANFTVVDDQTIQVILPIVDALGALAVTITNPGGSASIPLLVKAPATPSIIVGSGVLLWSSTEIKVAIANQPGELFYLFFSLSDTATSFPGVVDLALGAGGSDLFLIGSGTLSGGGMAEMTLPGVSVGLWTPMWAQAAFINPVAPSFPLPVSNLAQGSSQ